MRRRKRDSEGSLDSLLDTMTNVVGILVIVLVITKLGVGQAVQRIRENLPDVSVEEHAETVELLAQTKENTKSWKEQLAEADKPLTDEQINALWEKIDAIELEVVKANETDQALAALMPQVQAIEQQVQSATKQIVTMTEQLEKVEELVATTPKPEAPKPKVVNLPNPRAAPENVAPAYFVCKEGKIVQAPLDSILRFTQARLRQLQVKPDKDGKEDCAKVVELFNRAAINNPLAKAQLKVINYRLYLVVESQMDRGETVEQIAAADSKFQRQVRALRAQGRYAKFMVWADSYDVYLAARAQVHAADVPAGWIPYHPNAEWRIVVPGAPVCFRPPPPPPPDPDPNKGKQPPKPTIPPPPQPKKVPNDDID